MRRETVALWAWLAAGCGGAPRQCDPVSQSCEDAHKKCVITSYGENGMSAATACVAATGAKQEGDGCTRGASTGTDDCAAGLVCSDLGTLTMVAMSHCWKLCAADGGCDPAKKCATQTEMPIYGLCLPICAPFGPCPDPLNCSFPFPDVDGSSYYLACREPGPKTAGMTCADDTQCAADLICDPLRVPRTCIALCDATHSCPTGTCFEVPGAGGSSICF